MTCSGRKGEYSYPLLSISNILKATETLDSGILRRVTKKMYLVSRKNSLLSKLHSTWTQKQCVTWQKSFKQIKRTTNTHSTKEMSPSLLVSKSIKFFEGSHCNSPGTSSPLRKPSLTRFDSEGGKTGTMARIKSAGVIKISPLGLRTDAKYSKTCT